MKSRGIRTVPVYYGLLWCEKIQHDPFLVRCLAENPRAWGLLVKRGQLTRPSFGVSRTLGASRPGSLPMAEGPLCPQAQSLALGRYQL